MTFLLNIVLALIAGFLADYVARRCSVEGKIAVLIGVAVGIIVFLANPAAQIIT